jgi:hypothetical protein
MQLPEPLAREELERLWRFERRTVRFHAVAVPLLIAAAAAVFVAGDAVWVRRSALVLVVVLVAGATILQLSERCPRCRTRLRVKALMRLPDRCGFCGVAFERPPPA